MFKFLQKITPKIPTFQTFIKLKKKSFNIYIFKWIFKIATDIGVPINSAANSEGLDPRSSKNFWNPIPPLSSKL